MLIKNALRSTSHFTEKKKNNSDLLRAVIRAKTSLNLAERVSVCFLLVCVKFSSVALNSTVEGTWHCVAIWLRFPLKSIFGVDRTVGYRLLSPIHRSF